MRRIALAVAALAALASCSDDGGSPAQRPTPTPSESTPAAKSNVRSGSVDVTVEGDESFEMKIPLSTADSQFNPAPAGFAFVFKDGNDNLVTLGGESFQGSKKTAGTLALGIVFNREGRVIAHTDTGGGCDLTMNRAGKTVTGTINCGSVEDGRYRVRGTFTVQLV